jgi:hypothetical protein
MFLAGPGRHSVYEAMVSRPCRADDGSRIAAADALMLFSRRVSFRRRDHEGGGRQTGSDAGPRRPVDRWPTLGRLPVI